LCTEPPLFVLTFVPDLQRSEASRSRGQLDLSSASDTVFNAFRSSQPSLAMARSPSTTHGCYRTSTAITESTNERSETSSNASSHRQLTRELCADEGLDDFNRPQELSVEVLELLRGHPELFVRVATGDLHRVATRELVRHGEASHEADVRRRSLVESPPLHDTLGFQRLLDTQEQFAIARSRNGRLDAGLEPFEFLHQRRRRP